MFVQPPAAVQDAALLLARVVLGVVLIAHGLQKFATYGLAGVTASFEQMGIPAAPAAAAFAAVVELVGGALLIAGAATSIVAVLVALDMLGAFVFVHAGNGVFVDGGGFELVALILVLALVLGAVGAGRWSVDGLVGKRTPVAVEA